MDDCSREFPAACTKADSAHVCAENIAADGDLSGSARKSPDSRQGAPGAQASLATIDSLASSIEERKISDGSSLPPSSLPQPLTPRTAALLQRVSEAAAGRQGSSLKPTDSRPTESSDDVAPPVPGASLPEMDLQLPAQGLTVSSTASTQAISRQADSEQTAEVLASQHSTASQPAQVLDEAPATSGWNAPLNPSGLAKSARQPRELTPGNGVADPALKPDQAQASPQKRPATAAASSLGEHQTQSPKRHHPSGKPYFLLQGHICRQNAT